MALLAECCKFCLHKLLNGNGVKTHHYVMYVRIDNPAEYGTLVRTFTSTISGLLRLEKTTTRCLYRISPYGG